MHERLPVPPPPRPDHELDRLQALIVVPVLLAVVCAALAVAWQP